MKKILLFLSILISSFVFSQGVAINSDGSSPNSSAILDVKSTTKGMLIPRMTQSERNAITSPASGLMVYQTNGTTGFYFYDGSTWVRLATNTESSYVAGTGISVTNNTITNTSPDQTVTLTSGGATTITGTYPNFTISSTDNNSGGTVTSVSAGTGLNGGTITSTGTISMPNVGASGTYGSSTQVPVFTTDAQGRVSSVTNTTITGTTPGGTAGGDLSGTYPNPTVSKINGATLGTTTATSGNLLIGSGTQWVSTAVSGDATISNSGVVTLGTTSNNYIKNGTSAQTADYNITGNATIGTALSVGTNGTFTGDVNVNGSDINGPGISGGSSGILRINSNTDVRVALDADNNGNQQFEVTPNGTASAVFSVTEAGNVTANGTIRTLETGATPTLYATLQSADLTANRTITLPDAAGTVAVSASGNIALSAVGNITFTGTLPVVNGGTGASTIATTSTNAAYTIPATAMFFLSTATIATSSKTLTLPTLTAGTTDGRVLYLRQAGGSTTLGFNIAAAAGNTVSFTAGWANPIIANEGVILVASGTTWYMIAPN